MRIIKILLNTCKDMLIFSLIIKFQTCIEWAYNSKFYEWIIHKQILDIFQNGNFNILFCT